MTMALLGVQGNIHWVVASESTLLDRIHKYVDVLSNVSREFRVKTANRSAAITHKRTIGEEGSEDHQLYLLKNEPSIQAVALAWIDDKEDVNRSWTDPRNMLMAEYQHYYRPAERKFLCAFKRLAGMVQNLTYPVTCESNTTVPQCPVTLDHSFLDQYTYSAFRTAGMVPHFKLFYIHLIQHAVVDNLGDVFTGEIKIVPLACKSVMRVKTSLPSASE